MSIYTAPTTSFIDTYTNAAKYRDARTDAANKRLMDGMTSLIKGSADAYKWQQRKNIVDEMDDLDKREKAILEELEKLKAERDNTAQSNMTAIMQSRGWKGIPYPYSNKADDFVSPVGLGVYKKELL